MQLVQTGQTITTIAETLLYFKGINPWGHSGHLFTFIFVIWQFCQEQEEKTDWNVVRLGEVKQEYFMENRRNVRSVMLVEYFNLK